jgi:hypothetical protein
MLRGILTGPWEGGIEDEKEREKEKEEDLYTVVLDLVSLSPVFARMRPSLRRDMQSWPG